MVGSSQDPTLSDQRDQIAAEVLRVHEDSYGAGAGKVTVHILEDIVFVVLDELELTAMETSLLEGGHSDTIGDRRSAFEHAINGTFGAIVERATGRRVTSFLSSTSVSSRYSVEVFRLAAWRGRGVHAR